MRFNSLTLVLTIQLMSLFSISAIAGNYKCRWESKWYSCDYVFSGKYMTVYRSDGKEFTFYTDALDGQTTNWYETTGKRREGHFISVTLNKKNNAIRMFLSNGKELAILEVP